MLEIQIRKATLSDLQLIETISKVTFSETFAAVNTEANLATYIQEKLNNKVLSEELQSKQSAFYLALSNENVLGYLKINWGTAQTESQVYNALEIHRIYVLKEFHSQKIGYLLLLQAIAVANRNKMEYIWLGVWENNHKALAFYKKNDFIAFDTHTFTLGAEIQTDLLLKLKLKK